MDTKTAEFAQKLGARIVQLRREHNFAQERLATLARMNKGYLSSVESGQRIPSVGMLARLSKVLQVQIFDLFVFPDAGGWDRLWEELRRGESAAAEQLRSQYGLGGGGSTRGATKTPRTGRTTHRVTAAAAAAKTKKRAAKSAPAKAKPTAKAAARKPPAKRVTKRRR